MKTIMQLVHVGDLWEVKEAKGVKLAWRNQSLLQSYGNALIQK